MVPIEELAAGAIVLVRAGEKTPVDGTVVAGEGAVNEAAITGESLPVDKAPAASVLAGTLVESGAFDIRTEKVGPDTLFAQIVALVEDAGSETAPVQKLADRVAAWLLPLVLVFLIVVFVVTQDYAGYPVVGVGVVHVLGITAARMGWIGPIQAALLHLGPDILVFLNSVKLLRVKLDQTG